MRLSGYLWPSNLGSQSAVQNGRALMERLKMIHEVDEGLYVWSPLGLKSLKAVSAVMRIEQEKIGGLECMMTIVQPQTLWEQSGRLGTFGMGLVTFSDHRGGGLLCGPTGEEIMTDFFKRNVPTADMLPKMFFQLQWKFQDQASNNFGIFKSREFITQDGYSFDVNANASRVHYEKILGAYACAFEQLRLDVIVVPGLGDRLSHQLVVLSTNVGEDYAFEDAARLRPGMLASCLTARSGLASHASLKNLPNRARGIPVGCLDDLGTRYSETMGVKVEGSSGPISVFMGAYRINLSALTAVVVDVNLDDRGTIWPVSATPFSWGMLPEDTPKASARAEALYVQCEARGLDVLYDDRSVPASQKRLEMDCLGLPYQVWVGAEQTRVIERASGAEVIVSDDALPQEGSGLARLFEA